ncbi:hypothetical protein DFJ58DRAFT_818635 [Suillus subalutaceus]|uniref:uncharacterized protein n=1 Tax=Suillus subalutaceus TaxID=48586 RepID=UPI001B867B2C|nr:uncharacterized protein DFJ58DRAFT_818635 [Suillus subalutaceus]KAG1836356.1 hypothetical protein DFJ58DRAFT_818635 [Suillus subalutaceus]
MIGSIFHLFCAQYVLCGNVSSLTSPDCEDPSSALCDVFPTLPTFLPVPVTPSVITAPIFHCLVPIFGARSASFKVPWTLIATSCPNTIAPDSVTRQ